MTVNNGLHHLVYYISKNSFDNIGSVCWPYNISWLQHLPMKIFVGKLNIYNKNNIEMYALAPVALHCPGVVRDSSRK